MGQSFPLRAAPAVNHPKPEPASETRITIGVHPDYRTMVFAVLPTIAGTRIVAVEEPPV